MDPRKAAQEDPSNLNQQNKKDQREGRQVKDGREAAQLPGKVDNITNETEVPRSTAPAQAVLGRRNADDFIGQVSDELPATFAENGLKRTKFAC